MVMTDVKIRRWIEKNKVDKLKRFRGKLKKYIVRYHKPELIEPLVKHDILDEADIAELEFLLLPGDETDESDNQVEEVAEE